MKLLQYLCIPFLLLLTGCAGCGDDDPLSISKTEYSGNQLRIDGYYYYTFKAANNQEKLSDFYFLYRNGVILYAGTYPLGNVQYYESEFRSKIWNAGIKNSKTYWGLFSVQGNQIQFDHWYPSERPYSAFARKGTILNDTTFTITERYSVTDRNDKTASDEIYRFKQFSPKPDSTNPFVVRF
ncbi:MAG TPA: hypothetical protein VEC36_14000 [Patescibacteria group bacterium]|nr:hypothetical protein [Patescibacteria group bacterium]